jgi:hypothetical protein
MLVHLVARAAQWRPFLDWNLAAKTWRALRLLFPATFAAMLMPNHLHVIAEVGDDRGVRLSLAHMLAALTRDASGQKRPPVGPRWELVPPPEVIRDAGHLSRQVRYVSLNPCRAKLVLDPLEWEWSTHRDVVGAVAVPWVAPAALATAVRARTRWPAEFAATWHTYVSGDPSCAVAGTRPPHSASTSELATVPLGRIAAAAAAAMRAQVLAIRGRTATRRLFVHLAWRQGWRDSTTLARACGTPAEAVRLLRGRPIETLLPAGELCLGDDRLLRCRSAGVPECRGG